MIERIADELEARIEDDKPDFETRVINHRDTTYYHFIQDDDPCKSIVAEPDAIVEIEQ